MKRSGTISIWSGGSAYQRATSGGSTAIGTRGSAWSWRPTLVLALDAHAAHPGPFTVEDLLPYRTAREPRCQAEARARRTIMRRARSKKSRPLLLAELERRYREASGF